MSATAYPAPVAAAATRSVSVATSQVTMWPMYTTLFASTCIVVGLLWDISWHRTVGRDTFWTYPHVLEQVAAIVSGIGCGWLVLWTTFSRGSAAAEVREASVQVWGFKGSVGAWLCIWGTVMMITSAPFDNWWHNAYGLDVKIISPPHMVLAAGMIAINWGALLVALAAQNRGRTIWGEAGRERLGLPFAFGAGLIMCGLATLILEQAGFPNEMHQSFFYKVTTWTLLFPLVAFARACSVRWPATTIAAVYTGVMLVMMWVLQAFSATPKLAPIYNPVTHMVPPPFPYLLIVPAVVLDLLMQRFGEGKDWALAVILGGAFVAVFFAVQWPFADFMLSPTARNAFFAADLWDYNIRPGPWQHRFWALDRDATGEVSQRLLIHGLAVAVVYGIVAARLGLWLGSGMRRIKR